MIPNIPQENANQKPSERLDELCRALTRAIDMLNYELGIIEDRLNNIEKELGTNGN